MPPTEHEIARRYYEAAVRDANRQILVIQALVDTNNESYLTQADASFLTDLNTEEEAILNDRVDSKTSEEFFARVRQENANLYGSVKSVKNSAEK